MLRIACWLPPPSCTLCLVAPAPPLDERHCCEAVCQALNYTVVVQRRLTGHLTAVPLLEPAPGHQQKQQRVLNLPVQL